MADIEIRRVHGMAQAAAREAAGRVAEKLSRKFGLRGDWDGDVLRFQGSGVTGTVVVGPKDVSLSVALGLLLKAMKGSIEQSIQHELDELFAEKNAGAPKTGAATAKPQKTPPRPRKGG